jgi:hypothetical protein
MEHPCQEDGKRRHAPVGIIKTGIVEGDTANKYKESGGNVIYKGSGQYSIGFSGKFIKEEDGDKRKQVSRQADQQGREAVHIFHRHEYNDYQL